MKDYNRTPREGERETKQRREREHSVCGGGVTENRRNLKGTGPLVSIKKKNSGEGKEEGQGKKWGEEAEGVEENKKGMTRHGQYGLGPSKMNGGQKRKSG